jgi:uncharacterized NAD(P)/FAD-binding protein YdhS
MTSSIAIVGAGFTGTLLAVHLLRHASCPLKVFLIEKREAFCRGLAYSTGNRSHLLNVRVANMSAFPDNPHHFLMWLWKRDDLAAPAHSIPPSGHAFVPRWLYGTYLEDQLDDAMRGAAPNVTCEKIAAEAIDLAPGENDHRLRLSNGADLRVHQVALCLGHFPPQLPCEPLACDIPADAIVRDPWDSDALERIPPDASVLIIGTGLTMVDVVIGLLDQGHRGPISALSRRGLLPTRHAEAGRYADFLKDRALPTQTLAAFRLLRAEVYKAAAAGFNWRSVIDAVRPHTQKLWQNLPIEERRRFLRHVRPYWEVHRHRTAPSVANRISKAMDQNQLTVRRGRLRTITAAGARVGIMYWPPDGPEGISNTADVVINCAGPDCDFSRIQHPLVSTLLDQGLIRPDPLGLGIETTPDGEVVNEDGVPVRGLLALGPIARGMFWELTAVPELRSHCAAIGRRITASLPLTADTL